MKKLFWPILSVFLFALFLTGIFKHISYPLLWEDEAMTAVGAEVVLTYAYPKVHGEKNVFYDLRHDNPRLGINEKNDSFAASSSWGSYYFAIIGHSLAKNSKDIYTQTAILRASFAVIGIIGLLFLLFVVTRFLPNKLWRWRFTAFFMLCCLLSVSFALHIKEVRYYALVVFLTSFINGLYLLFRFYRPFNKVLFIAAEIALLWCLFVTFSPLYFICLLCLGLAESFLFLSASKSKDLFHRLKNSLPLLIVAVLSLLAVAPMISEFKYFEISKEVSTFNGFNADMYWRGVGTIFAYFSSFDLLWLALILEVLVLLNIKKIRKNQQAIFLVTAFLLLFFMISCFVLPRIPQFIFTRYFVFLMPVLWLFILLNVYMLMQELKNKVAPLAIFGSMLLVNIVGNTEAIQGRIYELTHQYKGPLDYTIPYIKSHYPNPDTLIIAANYEEYSYMYYLKSKVIVGYVGNNLEEDAKLTPDIIAYRKSWQNFVEVFNGFLQRATYEAVEFNIYDSPVNTIPELHFMPAFNHQFKTKAPANQAEATFLYIKK